MIIVVSRRLDGCIIIIGFEHFEDQSEKYVNLVKFDF